MTNTVTPSSELDLANLITKIYFPKVNTACRLSLGSNALSLYAAPVQDKASSAPTFLANYANDGDRTLSGLPRGRVVGLVKSFDRWNTGMRREGPARKVEYLKGLAHLQKCMRDHSCRYGFIITEIELVCVRAGCDDKGQPYFGKLELSEAIATKTATRCFRLGTRHTGAGGHRDDGHTCACTTCSCWRRRRRYPASRARSWMSAARAR